MSAEHARTRTEQPLGAILVDRGVLAPEQLEEALAEQQRCGRPLGEVIVRLGLAAGPTIAQALATQHGRVFKSEYGFATGFDAELDTAVIGEPPVTIRDARAPDAELRTRLASAEALLDDLAEQLAMAAHRLVAFEQGRDAAVSESAALAARIVELESELVEARAAAGTLRAHSFE
jgi:hypothetical protein